jgi:CheY-like chemotaxis protein
MPPVSPARKTRVLVIDDDEAVLEATTGLLRSEGFDVVAAPHGEAGVEAVKARPFDVVIVDVFMPGMDGLATTRAIRQYNKTVQIIAVSGFMLGHWRLEMPNFVAMAAEAGACSTLYKPFRPAALLQAIAEALGTATPQAAAR